MQLGRLPVAPMRSIIDAHAREYTITRSTETVNDVGEVIETESTVTRRLWCYTPQAGTVQTQSGERTRGMIQALCLPSEDIQLDDRLTHQAIEYEVDSRVNLGEETPTMHEFSLIRVNGPQ